METSIHYRLYCSVDSEAQGVAAKYHRSGDRQTSAAIDYGRDSLFQASPPVQNFDEPSQGRLLNRTQRL
jgi:hypothetical protein